MFMTQYENTVKPVTQLTTELCTLPEIWNKYFVNDAVGRNYLPFFNAVNSYYDSGHNSVSLITIDLME